MREMEQRIRRVVENLSFQVLSLRTRHTPAVYNLLQDLLKDFKILERQKREDVQSLQISYDLLLMYSNKIEEVYGRREWTVEQLHLLLDECYTHPKMPESIKKDLPIRRGIVTHKYLSWGESYALSIQAYQRLQSLFFTDFPLSTERRLKLTLGNVFAGYKNATVLMEIYPSIVQLNLPLDPLKEEYEGFLNYLITSFLTDPKLNGQLSVLTLNNRFSVRHPMYFDFAMALKLLLDLANGDIRFAKGDNFNSLDVKVVVESTALLKKMTVLLFSGAPSKMDIALHQRPALQAILLKIFKPIQSLQPIYTWGAELDQQFNQLLDEVKAFAANMLTALTPLSAVLAPPKLSWNIVGLWGGAGHAISSMIEMTTAMFRSFIPKFNMVVTFFMPDGSLSPLLKKCQEPLADIREHGKNLALHLEQLGLYHDVTQAAMAPFIKQFLLLNMDAVQSMFAIYRDQFEQFILDPTHAKELWSQMKDDKQREILMNAAAIFYHLNEFLVTALPLLSIDKLRSVHDAFNLEPAIQTEFDAVLVALMKIQEILKENCSSIQKIVLDIFSTPGERLTVGDATYSVVSSNGGVFSSTLGSLVGGVVDTFSNYRLNLDFNPSASYVKGLPENWQGKKLKAILKQEIEQTFMILDKFNALPLAEAYLNPSVHRRSHRNVV